MGKPLTMAIHDLCPPFVSDQSAVSLHGNRYCISYIAYSNFDAMAGWHEPCLSSSFMPPSFCCNVLIPGVYATEVVEQLGIAILGALLNKDINGSSSGCSWLLSGAHATEFSSQLVLCRLMCMC